MSAQNQNFTDIYVKIRNQLEIRTLDASGTYVFFKTYWGSEFPRRIITPQSTFNCSKSAIETLKKSVKYVQS